MYALTSLLDRVSGSRRHAYAALAIVGLALFIPLLGYYGLWDPYEVRIADMGKEMVRTHSHVVPASYGRPPLLLWAISSGMRLFGRAEWAGRLPVALMSIAALLACYYAGTALARRRGALLGSLVLAMTPAFFLGARQLTSFVAPTLSTVLAVGALAHLAWPASDARPSWRLGHFALAVVGLALGFLSAGFGLGVAVPLVAVTIALLCAPADAVGTKGPAIARVAFGAASLGALGLLVFAWWRARPGGAHTGYSPLMGGTLRPSAHAVEYVTMLKQVGFGAFPWIALLPLAAGRTFATIGASTPISAAGGEDTAGAEAQRLDFGRIALLSWIVLTFVGDTLFSASVGDIGFGGYAAVALAAGTFLDDLWDEAATPAFAGLIAGIGAVVIAHDFVLQPEHWAGAHVLEGIKWPAPMQGTPIFMLVVGLVWALLIALACAVKPLAPNAAADDPERVTLFSRQPLLVGMLGVSLISTLVSIYWITPSLSAHLSYKGLFTKYKSMVGTGDSEIGKYHVPGQLSDYAQTSNLPSLPALFDFLAKPKRVFIISSSDDLAAIDQYARNRAVQQVNAPPVSYYVVDDSNSKFMMLSNQPGQQKDLNPLRRFVIKDGDPLPTTPQHEAHADLEGKVEIIGYDLPAEIERGKPFKMRLYYKVKQALVSPYKVFVHFDGAGTRFNGDHVPLEGRFATNYWVPGYVVIDEHEITADRMMAPSGVYQILTGFWLGEQRLKVLSGPHDGENRVRLGTVVVR